MADTIDYSLDKLKEFTGDDPQQLNEILQLFIKSAGDNLKAFQEAIAQKKLQHISDLAHKMLTMFSQLEVNAVSSLLRLIEKPNDLMEESDILTIASKAAIIIEQLLTQMKAKN